MQNKRNVVIGIIASVVVVLGIVSVVLVQNNNHKKDDKKDKTEQVSKKSSSSKPKLSESKSVDKETLDANQKEVEVNPSGETATDRRTTDVQSTGSQVSEKDIETAGETGEHSEKVFDVTTKDGTNISEKDIANARKTLKDAGINDGVYSDLDIAKVIKTATDKSLDIVTVAKDGKF